MRKISFYIKARAKGNLRNSSNTIFIGVIFYAILIFNKQINFEIKINNTRFILYCFYYYTWYGVIFLGFVMQIIPNLINNKFLHFS